MTYEQAARADEGLTLQETNAIQAELIIRSGADPAEWIQKYSAAMRSLFTELPHLAQLYRTDAEAALELLSRKLGEVGAET